ncbi:MAG: hypothetical protein IJW00_03115 [Clostridia bacterium]|nr:hypothetical protein [Clostridia bacterium]
MNQSPKSAHPALTLLRKLTVTACCVFTALTMLLLLIQWLIEQNLDKSINAKVFLMLLPLSLCIAGADMIRKTDKLPTGSKIILHPLLCLGGIFLAYLPYMIANDFSASTVLVHMVFFAAVYGVVTATVCLITMAMGKKKEKKEPIPYKSQFNLDKK